MINRELNENFIYIYILPNKIVNSLFFEHPVDWIMFHVIDAIHIHRPGSEVGRGENGQR